MKRKEKQEKFHNSLINLLYAPPPDQFDHQTLNLAREIVNSNHHPISTSSFIFVYTINNNYLIGISLYILNFWIWGNCTDTDELKKEEDANDDDDEGGLGFAKLTRAQRKRLRKKKLKEAACNRREIIGPQLPGKSEDDQQSEGVRRNAAERVGSGNEDEHSKTSSVFVNMISLYVLQIL